MRVYFDSNVLIDIENGLLQLKDFLVKNVEYFYSSSHIDELLEGAHLEQVSIEKRLNLIERLAKDNCIVPTNNHLNNLLNNLIKTILYFC